MKIAAEKMLLLYGKHKENSVVFLMMKGYTAAGFENIHKGMERGVIRLKKINIVFSRVSRNLPLENRRLKKQTTAS